MQTRHARRGDGVTVSVRRAVTARKERLAAAAHMALKEDYCRIDWTADAGNEGAQRLYDRLGVPRQDKRFYRLAGDDLNKFAQ